MKTYEVTIPIAGHAYLTVQAGSEKEAIEIAIGEASLSDVEEWEALEQFIRGNVCHCPSPWEAEARCADDDEAA